MSSLYYAGIEGGATNTVFVILDGAGVVVSRASGEGTNAYLVGVPAVAATVERLAREALASAGVAVPAAPAAAPVFVSLGMCASGFAEQGPQDALVAALRASAPWLAGSYYVDNDSFGSIFTAAGDAGGSVIIAGTGSIAQLVPAAPGGAPVTVGGHGHMLGDEGSAWSVASTALRAIFADADALVLHDLPPPSGAGAGFDGDIRVRAPDATAARAAMLSYFDIRSSAGMLDIMYGDAFNKARVAGFAKSVAALAAGGDAFSLLVFGHVGRELGAMARALSFRARVQALTIVAVGSVWKSWPLLASGFERAAFAKWADGGALTSFRLLRLRESSAVGAAWRGAQLAGTRIPLDDAANTEVLAIGSN